jgi:hypothetical protein
MYILYAQNPPLEYVKICCTLFDSIYFLYKPTDPDFCTHLMWLSVFDCAFIIVRGVHQFLQTCLWCSPFSSYQVFVCACMCVGVDMWLCVSLCACELAHVARDVWVYRRIWKIIQLEPLSMLWMQRSAPSQNQHHSCNCTSLSLCLVSVCTKVGALRILTCQTKGWASRGVVSKVLINFGHVSSELPPLAFYHLCCYLYPWVK